MSGGKGRDGRWKNPELTQSPAATSLVNRSGQVSGLVRWWKSHRVGRPSHDLSITVASWQTASPTVAGAVSD